MKMAVYINQIINQYSPSSTSPFRGGLEGVFMLCCAMLCVLLYTFSAIKNKLLFCEKYIMFTCGQGGFIVDGLNRKCSSWGGKSGFISCLAVVDSLTNALL